MRSAEECEISRSARAPRFRAQASHRRRTMRASPVTFPTAPDSLVAASTEEPFWSSEKNSSASSTSVRWRWRNSVASRSAEAATTPEGWRNTLAWTVARDDLGRERLDPQPHGVREWASTRGSTCAKVPRSRKWRRSKSRRAAATSRARARTKLSVSIGELEARRWSAPHGLPCERPIVGRHLVLEGAALERGGELVDVGNQQIGGALSCTLSRCRARRRSHARVPRRWPPARRSRRGGLKGGPRRGGPGARSRRCARCRRRPCCFLAQFFAADSG